MNDSDLLKVFFSLLAVQLPILLICLVGVVTILIRWKEASKGAIWALLAFGLATFLCFAMPFAQASLQKWAAQGSVPLAERASTFAVVGFVWSFLRAVTYILLLVAVLAGRSYLPSTSGTR